MSTQTHQQRIQQHLPYAKALAAKVRQQVGLPTRVDQQELEGWAILGLVEASDRFDPARAVAFSTFAYRRVVGAVLNGIGKMVDAPVSAQSKANRQARLQEALPDAADRSLSADSAERELVNATRRVGAVLALETLQEAAAPQDSNPLASLADKEDLERLSDAVRGLPAKLRRVIQLHHFDGLAMAKVGQRMGISTPTVCRWNRQALKQIAKAMGGERAVLC